MTRSISWISPRRVCAASSSVPITFWSALARSSTTPARSGRAWRSKASASAGQPELTLYLKAIEHAANAVACLSGPPLTERRFLLGFSERAAAAKHPGLFPGLLGMLGASHASQEALRLWLPQWDETFAALPEAQRPVHLQPARHAYYLHAFRSLVEGAQPQAVLWPLLRTWTRMVSVLPVESPVRKAPGYPPARSSTW